MGGSANELQWNPARRSSLSPRPAPTDFPVDDIRLERKDGAWVASADLDGERLWFSTRDVELRPAPEAFATAAMIPAAADGRAVRVAAPLDPVWRQNAGRALGVLREWWRYDAPPPVPSSPAVASGSSTTAAERSAGPDPTGRTALFFSGGVDSFHVLLSNRDRIDVLVMVQGFDFELDDEPRATDAERSLREVAAGTGKQAVFLRTNVKIHSRLARVTWDRTHGAAMAAIAHLLSGQVDHARIAPSLPGDQDVPWGTHPLLDPLWSSARMAIASEGPGDRMERVRAIAMEPLAWDHLRVCWQNFAPTGNCGRCAKCIVAMVMLEACGALQHYRVFGDTSDLIARVDALRRTADRYQSLEQILREGRLKPDVARAVRDLARRSRIDKSWPVQLRRRVAGVVLGWFGVVRKS